MTGEAEDPVRRELTALGAPSPPSAGPGPLEDLLRRHADLISRHLEAGVSVRRIHAALERAGVACGYTTLCRRVRKMKPVSAGASTAPPLPLPRRRSSGFPPSPKAPSPAGRAAPVESPPRPPDGAEPERPAGFFSRKL